MGKACPFDQHIQFELHFHLMGLCHSARSRAARHLRTNVDLTISSLQGRTALSVSCSSKTNLTTVTTSFLHNSSKTARNDDQLTNQTLVIGFLWILTRPLSTKPWHSMCHEEQRHSSWKLSFRKSHGFQDQFDEAACDG